MHLEKKVQVKNISFMNVRADSYCLKMFVQKLSFFNEIQIRKRNE